MTTKDILQTTKDLHVLYVEDDADIRKKSMDLFHNFFEHITTVKDGVEALEEYNKNHYDIIITDISMPRMDGIELISIIRKDKPKIPIIVYSAWNNSSYMSDCISLNVDGYLLKPMQVKNLIEVLEKVTIKLVHFPT